MTVPYQGDEPTIMRRVICNGCDGAGHQYGLTCDDCGGRGSVMVERPSTEEDRNATDHQP